MPYAANNQISHDAIPGGIEVTETQYAEALEGMLEGKVVSIEGGFSVAFPPEPEPEPQPEPELIDPLMLPLDRVRFEFLRDKLDRDKPGFIDAAEALFDNLPEDTPTEVDFKLLAKVLWRTGQEFYIHHGLFALAVHEGIITQQELEDAWRAGVVLSW